MSRVPNFGPQGTPHAEAWRTSQAISPRSTVRIATVDAYGQVLNAYVSEHHLADDEPDRPWAVNLADAAGGYRLVVFDLDAKTPEDTERAHTDAQTLAHLLTDAGLEPVVCASGPTGGRHVWTALREPVDAATVRVLAQQAKRLCPTLDVAPLTNPATGCVRPPGAPHRSGGRSTVLSGDLTALTAPTGTVAQVVMVAERLIRLVGSAEPAAAPANGPLPLDDAGLPYLPGPRRELPSTAAAALGEDAASGDANTVAWRILTGAAYARWRYADVAALAATASGLEHIRTERSGGRRIPRPARGGRSPEGVLKRQWSKAVAHVAATPRRRGDDPTFNTRAGHVADIVHDVQQRADASAGRWTSRSGPTDRRILDVLSMLALTAVSASVEADTRRVALLAGIGRETARTGLLRLARDGWITQTKEADGPHAAHWQLIHNSEVEDRSQAVPRPEGAGSAHRDALLTTLTQRAGLARHDIFTHGQGLGHHAGNVYARLGEQEANPSVATLNRLAAAGVIAPDAGSWRRLPQDRRDRAAKQLGVAGRLRDREARYRTERDLWAWWLAELAWMTAPGRHARRGRRRGTVEQPALALGHVWDLHPPMPREHGTRGRVVWSDARAILAGHKPDTPTQQPDDHTAALALLRDVLGAELVA